MYVESVGLEAQHNPRFAEWAKRALLALSTAESTTFPDSGGLRLLTRGKPLRSSSYSDAVFFYAD